MYEIELSRKAAKFYQKADPRQSKLLLNQVQDIKGASRMQTQNLFDKIQSLPPDKIAVVEDFVEFLRQRDDDILLTRVANKLSEKSFQKVWDNPDVAAYDNL